MRVRREPLSRPSRPTTSLPAATCSARSWVTCAPVFTPPWNRCAPWTAEVLRDLGVARPLPRPVRGRGGGPRPVGAPGGGGLVRQAEEGARGPHRQGRAAGRDGPGAGAGRGDAASRRSCPTRTAPTSGALLALLAAHPDASVAHLDRLALAGRLTRSGRSPAAQSRTTCGAGWPAVRLRVSKTFWLCRTIMRGVVRRVVGVHDHQIGGSQLLGAQLALDRHGRRVGESWRRDVGVVPAHVGSAALQPTDQDRGARLPHVARRPACTRRPAPGCVSPRPPCARR